MKPLFSIAILRNHLPLYDCVITSKQGEYNIMSRNRPGQL